jgi:LCP family protein required for cell wall assembly
MSAARRPAPLWARLSVAFGTALVVVSGLALVGGQYLLNRYTAGVHQESLLGGAEVTSPTGVAIDGPINVLLVGTDERPAENADGSRSDSIIIAHVAADHRRAYLVSIPRDTLVDIPPYAKNGYRGGRDKINAAYEAGYAGGAGRSGGFELLAETIKQLTGISFNGGAIVNFAGFQSLVAALGGVDLCVDEKTTSVHIGWTADGKETAPYRITGSGGVYPIRGVRPQVYQPGCQHMAAWQALDYVRQRELIPDGDYGRQRHQQQFLQAIMKQATGAGVMTNPVKLDNVLRSAGQALTFDRGGVALSDWIFTLKGIGPQDLTMLKTNGGNFDSSTFNGTSVELLSDDSRQLLAEVRDDTVASFVATHPTWVTTPAQP